jgi:hypothetical protein
MNYFITFKIDFYLNKLLLDASTDCCSYGQMAKHASGKITVESRGKFYDLSVVVNAFLKILATIVVVSVQAFNNDSIQMFYSEYNVLGYLESMKRNNQS